MSADGKWQWSKDELLRDFEVLGFSAPFVIVVRKSDGVRGSMEFYGSLRVYANFMSDD